MRATVPVHRCVLYEVGIVAAQLFIKHTKMPDADTEGKPTV